MAAIGRGFAFVGERVKDSRASLQLSADASDITTRLRDELSRCTVDLTPNTGGPDQAGYFLYYEGPVTDVTSSIFAVDDTDPENPTPFSRYGDFDDYLAFTAVAPPGSWFTGKVPRYMLDAKTVSMYSVNRDGDTMNNIPYDPANFPGGAFDPVVIRSRYAEIVYFASPEYDTGSLPDSPVATDADGDALPDRIRLHRRVLLIRPDLNIGPNEVVTPVGGLAQYAGSTATFMLADDWPTATNATATTPNLVDGWLFGMAAIHQQCDLSVRRVVTGGGGLTSTVAGNSLDDLSKPQNRFAHVQVPDTVLTGGTNAWPTSMPVLALGAPAAILTGSGTIAPALSNTSSSVVVTPSRLSGFIRPEFVLGSDLSHIGIADDGWGTRRLGEDVVTNNLLSFDLKIFDPSAVSVTTAGNLVVGPNDAGYREALVDVAANPSASVARGEIDGGFVDLMYPFLAGGALRGWQFDRSLDSTGLSSNAFTIPQRYVNSTYSGVGTATAMNATLYADSLLKSGKVVISANRVRLFQPTFDTFTRSFELDGYRQAPIGTLPNAGTVWSLTTGATADLGSNGLDDDGQFGADDLGEHETLPPFVTPAEAIQMSVRLYNPSTRQIKQMSVIHRGKR